MTPRPRPHRQASLTVALTLAALFAGASLLAQPVAPGDRPGATLLFPYFEVDLEDPLGINTLSAIGNATVEPIVAHVVVWTDWGVPTLTFDLNLDANAVATLSWRDVMAGRLPANSGGGACPQPALDDTAVTRLRAQHTGAAADDGRCYGSSQQGRAVGYATVDVVRGCAEDVTLPSQAGYFVDGGLGFATNDNVLWGDYEFVEPGENFAQGFEAVQIPADASYEETFYRPHLLAAELSPEGTEDNRAALGTLYRTRFLSGGSFDGDSELVVWLGEEFASGTTEGFSCNRGPRDACQRLHLRFFNEAGEAMSAAQLEVDRLALRLRLGEGGVATPAPFGILEVENRTASACFQVPTPLPLQAWPLAILRAEGRFSVGLRATRLD
jgi:hypothetical protein